MQLALEILFRKCFKQHQAICGNKRFQRAQELQLILAKDYSYEESAVQVQLLPTRTHTEACWWEIRYPNKTRTRNRSDQSILSLAAPLEVFEVNNTGDDPLAGWNLMPAKLFDNIPGLLQQD